MRTLQLHFLFMVEIEPLPIPCNENLPSGEGQAPDQPSKPLCGSASAAFKPSTGLSPTR